VATSISVANTRRPVGHRFVQVRPEILDDLAAAHQIEGEAYLLLLRLVLLADYATGQVVGTSLGDLGALVIGSALSDRYRRRVARRALDRLTAAGLVVEAPEMRVHANGKTTRTGNLNLDVTCYPEVVRGGRQAPQPAREVTPAVVDVATIEEIEKIAAEVEVPAEMVREIDAIEDQIRPDRGLNRSAPRSQWVRATRANAPVDSRQIDPPYPPVTSERSAEVVDLLAEGIGIRIKPTDRLRAAIEKALDVGWEARYLVERVAYALPPDARNVPSVLAARIRNLGVPERVGALEAAARETWHGCRRCGGRLPEGEVCRCREDRLTRDQVRRLAAGALEAIGTARLDRPTTSTPEENL